MQQTSAEAIVSETALPEGQLNNYENHIVIENIKGTRERIPLPDYVQDSVLQISENSRKVLERRYRRKDIDGTFLESAAGMFYRVARHVAQVENEHGEDAEALTETFYHLLTERRFFPNSPTFTGAGTPLGQLAACFVIPVADDMGQQDDGIFSSLRVAALIQQTGGGNGFAFSRLRPRGDVVHTSSGQATGPVGFLRVYDQAFGEVAQGGCLVPNTLVFTEQGLLRLDELVDTRFSGWQDHTISVQTDEGMRQSRSAYNHGVAPILTVETQQGITISGTPNHKVKIMREDGPTWCRLDELEAGDAILMLLGQHQGELRSLQQPQKSHGNQTTINLPPVLDEPLAFLLGYMAGDGFVASGEHDNRIGFSVAHDSYLIEELPELLAATFSGCNVHRQQKPNDASVTYVVDSAIIKNFMIANGFDKNKSHEVVVPKLVRQSPQNIVGAYLRGLFEADGSISHGYPMFNTTSPQLAQEAATLLIGLGCPVTVRANEYKNRWGDKPQWVVRINSHVGLDAWQENVSCDSRSRFAVCNTFMPDKTREVGYTLSQPQWWVQPVLDEITLSQVDRRGRGQNINLRSSEPKLRKKLLRYVRGDRNLTRSAYEELSSAYPTFAQHARPVENQWFVHVTNVCEAGKSLTLDLEVDENHTYLANGMVTHNSRRGANMAVLQVDHPDIEDFIECKASEGSIANFNISVAITDDFMRAVKDDTDFDLKNPRDNSVWKTVRARELFDKIITYAHHNGEPGALFIDAANRSNPVPHLYELEATNPCVTADTLIYTGNGLKRAGDLYNSQEDIDVVIDSRFGIGEATVPATSLYYTGEKQVYQLQTKEGYSLKATGNHQIMTSRGWVALEDLHAGDKVHILNQSGGFGTEGSLELGRMIGRELGENSLEISEEQELVPVTAGYVNEVSGQVIDKLQFQTHLKEQAMGLELTNKESIPEIVFTGTAEMQQGFLQGLFSADGTVLDNVAKGSSIRLWSAKSEILSGVQQLLLNFGIASRVYLNRKQAGYKQMPDSKGGLGEYYTQAGHELVISKQNMIRFRDEIGFLQDAKNDKLAGALKNYGKRGPYAEYFTATVDAIELLGIEPVYDLTEPRTHSFIANGIVVHNCGEQWLGPYENCCLGSINLGEHVTADEQGNPIVDWQLLERTIRESTHFLDNVVTTNKYVPAIPQVAEAAFRARRIGLGIMGLGDMMYKLGIRYGSEDGQEFAAQIMEYVRYHCMAQSIELASLRGPFLAYEGSIYDPSHPEGMQWQAPQPMAPYTRDWQRPVIDWQQIREGIMTNGIRNAAQTTVAPTGTIATVCGCEGYGCEPVFALGYIRHFKDGDNDVELLYTSPLFEEALQNSDLSPEAQEEIKQQVALYGNCQDIAGVPEQIRHAFVVSSDISAEQHVRMQAAIQAFVDNSISKCVVGDTLLLTANGLMPLEELSEMRQPDQFEALNIDIVSPMGIEPTDNFYYGGYRETRKVTFDYGFEIEGTPNHRIHVLDEDGSIQFRRLDQLQPGDTAVLYGNQQQFGLAGQCLPAYSGKLRTNSKTPTFPERMSEDLAFWLGCITSEGAITKNGLMISNNDRELLEELNRISTEIFQLSGHISKDKRNNVHYLQINSRALRNWLLADLVLEAGAENKIIPSSILRASQPEIAAFLRGLCLDGYMTMDGKLFGITVASQKMIAQLQTLMLNMGVLATARQTTDRAWNLTVQGGELEKLAQQISFVEVWKNDRIEERNSGRVSRYRNYSRLLPATVTQDLRQMQEQSSTSLRQLYDTDIAAEQSAYQRARVNLLQGHRLERGDAQRIYQHLSQEESTPFANTFFGHDSDNKVYVTVQSISAGYAEVFDISVPESHSFIANGLGNHNTCNFPEDATVDDVAKAYELAWDLGCKGLTVYVTGSRQQVVLETKATQKKKDEGAEAQESEQLVQEPTNGVSMPQGATVSANGASLNGARMNGASANGTHPTVMPTFEKRPRPGRLQGRTYRKETPLGQAYITINNDEQDEPFEVFLNVGKAGSDVTAVSEAIGRLISLALRIPSPLPPNERLRWVMDELTNIGSGSPRGFGSNRVRSLPDGIAQVLAEYLNELEPNEAPVMAQQLVMPMAQRPIGDLCPECGEASFLNIEGCRKCHICGYSEC